MLYKISCQCENKAQHCGWNTSAAPHTMSSYLKDWHAGPGATADIRADRIIRTEWLLMIVSQFKYRCGWHRLGSHCTFFLCLAMPSPRCQSSSWPTRKRTWRWTSVSTWRRVSRRRASSKITSRWDAAETRSARSVLSQNEHKKHTAWT